MDLGMVRAYTLRKLLHKYRLPGSRRRNDEGPLSLADGAEEIHDPHGVIVRRQRQLEPFERIDGGPPGERLSFHPIGRGEVVHRSDRLQLFPPPLAVCGRPLHQA
jgi:hypothetical protein